MSKQLKAALFFSAIGMVVSIIQGSIIRTMYVSIESTYLYKMLLMNALPVMLIWFGGGLLTNFLWNENPQHPFWKKTVLRTLIATLVIMVVNTFYTIIFHHEYIGENNTIIQYFFTTFESSFNAGCIYMLVWLIVPEDVEKSKINKNADVIDSELN